VFSGSDWCAPCIKLDKSIWQSTFEYAASNLILERADFPRKTKPIRSESPKQNEGLAHDIIKRGFPLVVVWILRAQYWERLATKTFLQTNISPA
jgi:hypothetical protein